MKKFVYAILIGVLAASAAVTPAMALEQSAAGDAVVAGAGSVVGEVRGILRAEDAASGTANGFTSGNLIADANFYDDGAMSEAAIQAFLVKMGAGCTSSSCLVNYRETTPDIDWSYGSCAEYAGAASEKASRIIFRVQQACGLSARVILVMLQKEQSLLTNRTPPVATLAKAMGYGCPDAGACDPEYASFFKQVAFAARQLTYYGTAGSSYTYLRVGAANPIAYSPKSSCGSGNVVIVNRATAALYYYTPFQPDAAALKNVYGTGGACSEYGNRNFWRLYTDWFGDPRSGAAITATRLQGADRYATAVAISRAGFPAAGVPVAYVAAGNQFADALAAAPAAAHRGGPLLLTDPTSLSAATAGELKRLKPKRIVVVGGTGAVSAGVATALGKIASTTRIGGSDRYDTSRRLASDAFGSADLAYVATGRDFPDGLSAGAAAGSLDVPVVLVDGRAARADSATIAMLRKLGVDAVRIAGGTGVVSAGVQSSLAASFSVTRYAGADRYTTSAAVNSVFRTATGVFIATGAAFPDALTGAAAAGTAELPLLLSMPNCTPVATRVAVFSKGATSVRLVGGTGALSDRVAKLQSC
ncbi:putative cell wall-binding protein [Agromyces terreus]|uniref:Cell wall-binding protein n=1 Tax=Agromyces terreus TaxID=424795 RepID=A0A9X2KCJ5_9MICO|nr:cell wall-binding repeat-containing protein [Agromyces terreus]MCP2371305.1 putative cell wall-binding protein [Agromyces terreus]